MREEQSDAKRERPDATTSQAPDGPGNEGPPDNQPLFIKFLLLALSRVWAVMAAVMSPMARVFKMRVEVLLFFLGLILFCWVRNLIEILLFMGLCHVPETAGSGAFRDLRPTRSSFESVHLGQPATAAFFAPGGSYSALC